MRNLLGLEDWTAVSDRLKVQHKRLAEVTKHATAGADELRAQLRDLDDPRATEALAALPATGVWDLVTLDALATGTAEPDPELGALRMLATLTPPDEAAVSVAAERLRDAATNLDATSGTDAEKALQLADLLDRALAVHAGHALDEDDCPVCGAPGALGGQWRANATVRATELRAEAASVAAAQRNLGDAIAAARRLASPVPAPLEEPPAGVNTAGLREAWSSFAELATTTSGPKDAGTAGAVALADCLEERALAVAVELPAVVDAANQRIERRQDRWRPLSQQITAWLDEAREAQRHTGTLEQLKAAGAWVTEEARRVQAERFAPVAQQVKAVWEQLRHDSNVSIDDLGLEGTTTRRQLRIGVSVDDTPAEGMSVLSQGELHALSLALFLPRATQGQSPFRFVLIDDPVQAFDAARVDGLAKVLASVAQSRQVVVFTHDARLPDACRRLDVAARVLEVSRGERSAVSVRALKGPAERYLDDARAVARTDHYPASARRKVLPGLCRQAVEAACVDLGRRRLLNGGQPFDDVDARVDALSRLLPHVAFALFGDGAKAGEVYAELNRWDRSGHSADHLMDLNKGAHRELEHDGDKLISDTEKLIALLREKLA